MATFFRVVVGINFNTEKALLQVASSAREAREMVDSLKLGAIKSVEVVGDAFIAWEIRGSDLFPVVPATRTYQAFNRQGRPVRVTVPESA